MSSPKRLSGLLDHWEIVGHGGRKIQDSDYDTKRAGLEKELREIQEAPVVIEPVVSLNTKPLKPRVPPRPTRNSTHSGASQQQSTPPPSPYGDFSIPESENPRIETESTPNRPPTPISPTTTAASKPPDRSTRPHNNQAINDALDNNPPIHALQLQLDSLKAEIEQIKLQREESDHKIAALETQLERAQDRAQGAVEQNKGLRVEIEELRARLRDAREEERRLNDEIRDMMRRERELLDEILEAGRAKRGDGGVGDGGPAMEVMGGKDGEEERQSKRSKGVKRGKERGKEKENVEFIMVRPIPLRKQSKSEKWRWPGLGG